MNQAVEKFHAKNTLEFKQAVAETIVDHLAPINAKMEFYKRNPQVVYDVINFSFTLLPVGQICLHLPCAKILHKGGDHAYEIAEQTMNELNELFGLWNTPPKKQ